MRDDTVLDIINTCIAINHRAYEIYIKLSIAETNEALKFFWIEMSHEEEIHATFWNSAKKIAEEHTLPHVFDDPSVVKIELKLLRQKVEFLLTRWETNHNMENALILAYRLEFYMLHPAFELLYHTLEPLAGGTDPVDTYDRHINRFIETFVRYGSVTPELELLGETLQSLWQRNKVLTKLSIVDSLTGILNRRGFLILAKELSYLAQRNKAHMGILMIDIDKFKKINDTHGHHKGDDVLKAVANSLKSSVRKSDIVGRFGGEEFIILFPATLPPAIKRIAETIRHNVDSSRPEGIHVTISIGVAQGVMNADPDTELFTWIAKADKCLY